MTIKEITGGIDSLYSGLQTTWDKVKADVIFHVALAFVVFFAIGVTLPIEHWPKIDIKQIQENEWYKFAQNTGILYLTPLLLITALIVYGSLMRALGRVMVTVFIVLFPPRINQLTLIKRFRWIGLEQIAILVQETGFSYYDLLEKMGELSSLYESRKGPHWESFSKAKEKAGKGVNIYMGHAFMFLIAWWLVFRWLPESSVWRSENEKHYWSVTLLLIVFILFARNRLVRELKLLTWIKMTYVFKFIRSDDELRKLIKANESRTSAVHERLEELDKIPQHQPPSFLAHILSRLSINTKFKLKKGYPFPKTYQRGIDFFSNHQQTTENWGRGYLDYLYSFIWKFIQSRLKTIFSLVRFLVSGDF